MSLLLPIYIIWWWNTKCERKESSTSKKLRSQCFCFGGSSLCEHTREQHRRSQGSNPSVPQKKFKAKRRKGWRWWLGFVLFFLLFNGEIIIFNIFSHWIKNNDNPLNNIYFFLFCFKNNIKYRCPLQSFKM